MSWPTVHAAFVAHADLLLTEPAASSVLGIDETRRGRPGWARGDDGRWRRLDRFEANFVDLYDSAGLLGQTAGRTSASVMSWLDARWEDWRNTVQVVAIDPCAAYRSAVEHTLPHARVVADRFHLVRLANDMVTEVRQRVAREQLGRRGRTTDPAWANRRLLPRAGDRLSPRRLGRLTATFATDDPTGEIGAAWGVKERLRMLLAATDRHTIATRLHRFHETVLIAEARREVLRAFVAQLVREFADLWPQPGTVTPGPVERRTNLVPWPVCWELHPLLVSLLWFVKDWHDALEDGVAAGGYREGADWFHFVRTEVVGLVRDISGRICRGGHVDASRTPAPRPEKTIVRPPLPGEAVVAEPPRAPVATGWREAMGEPPSPDDGVGR